jgi:FKBP-type peptidyl-prolyl cis-trans isomerase FklB
VKHKFLFQIVQSFYFCAQIKIADMKRLKIFTLVALASLLTFGCSTPIDKPEQVQPQTRMDSISYIIGFDYGQGIRDQEIKADPIMIYKGIADALSGDGGYFSDSIRELIIEDFNEELRALEAERFKKMVARNKEEGRKFLEENKTKQGVVELPSGLQYKIMKVGTGKQFPAQADSVTIHYRAMYTDRTTFDMSYETGPVSIRLNYLVKGLSAGIQLMKKGDIYEFYIPSELGYGDENYHDMIPGGSTIIYSVELIDLHN